MSEKNLGEIDVFLSYARADKQTAQRVFDALERHGLEVWWDFGLMSGSEFAQEIERVIGIATVTVVLWSEASTTSRWVISEANHADEIGSLVPFRLDETRIPHPFSRIQSPLLPAQASEIELNSLMEQVTSAVQVRRNEKADQVTENSLQNAWNFLKAKEVLKAEATKHSEDGEGQSGLVPSESSQLVAQLAEYLKPLENLGSLNELNHLKPLLNQAELANERPRTPTRIMLIVVGAMAFLGTVTTILTYFDISSGDLRQVFDFSDGEPEQDGIQNDRISETEASVSLPDASKSIVVDCDHCPEMTLVNGGRFSMGTAQSQVGYQISEGPQQTTTIGAPFYMSRYEVSVREWRHCVAGGGCSEILGQDNSSNPRLPVTNASWDDATAYAAWLSNVTGHEYRLPTEAEWEYAARANSTGPFSFGASVDATQANYDAREVFGTGQIGEYRGDVVEVGSFLPNEFGLFDMHGNVAEWTRDCWNPSYASRPRLVRETGTAWSSGQCFRRVIRGGSWGSAPIEIRSASRAFANATIASSHLGIRIVRVP